MWIEVRCSVLGRTLAFGRGHLRCASPRTAIAELGTRWGGPVELVLDFVGTGPPGPGESLQLVRSLAASGTVSRIVFIQKPWMPGVLVSSVTGVLRSAGLPIALRREGA